MRSVGTPVLAPLAYINKIVCREFVPPQTLTREGVSAMTIYHKHHYVPKHAGGSDHPSNLIEVTIHDHALFHYERWVLCGDENDRIAWLALSGMISKEDAIKHALKLGREKANVAIKSKYGVDNIMEVPGVMDKAIEKRKKLYANHPELILDFRSASTREAAKKALQKKHNVDNPSKLPHVRAVISQKAKIHQSGKGNSQWGTMWVTNGSLNMKIKQSDIIPQGFKPGRKIKRAAGSRQRSGPL